MKHNVLKRYKYTDEEMSDMGKKFLSEDKTWFYDIYYKGNQPQPHKNFRKRGK